jgi:hypothetical protein
MTNKAWIAGGVRLIKMMVELHRRGFQLLRICPYEYPLAWRLRIAPKSYFSVRNGAYIGSAGEHEVTSVEYATYSSADELKYFGWSKVEALDAEQLAGVFTNRFPRLCEAGSGPDWEYAGWLSELSGHVSRTKQLPFVMSEYFEPAPDELTYLPLRDYGGGGEISKFPLPPSVAPRDEALVEERDELRRKVGELMVKVKSAIDVLS